MLVRMMRPFLFGAMLVLASTTVSHGAKSEMSLHEMNASYDVFPGPGYLNCNAWIDAASSVRIVSVTLYNLDWSILDHSEMGEDRPFYYVLADASAIAPAPGTYWCYAQYHEDEEFDDEWSFAVAD